VSALTGGLPPELALTDNSTLELVPTLIRGTGDRFIVANRFSRGAIVTGSAGVRAIELLSDGRTLGEIKQVLARDCRCAPEEIDVGPLVAALWSVGLVSAVEGRRIAATPAPRPRSAGLYFALFVLSPLLSLVLRYVPLKLALWVAYRSFGARNPLLEHRIQVNLHAAPDLHLSDQGVRSIAADNSRNVRRQFIDRVLLGSLSPRRVERWLQDAASISGMEHLERSIASGRGTILCSYHMGSYSLIPFILGARGVALTVLGGFGERDQAAVAQGMALMSGSEVTFPVRVVSGRWALRALVTSLERGETVLLYCDRALPRADGVSRSGAAPRVPFLGTAVYATAGVARLSERTGAAILPTVLLWDGDQRHHLIIEPEVTRDPSADPTTRVPAATADVYRVLERYVRWYPADWLKWKDFRDMTCDDPTLAGPAER